VLACSTLSMNEAGQPIHQIRGVRCPFAGGG
jgi:hypothetical protein